MHIGTVGLLLFVVATCACVTHAAGMASVQGAQVLNGEYNRQVNFTLTSLTNVEVRLEVCSGAAQLFVDSSLNGNSAPGAGNAAYSSSVGSAASAVLNAAQPGTYYVAVLGRAASTEFNVHVYTTQAPRTVPLPGGAGQNDSSVRVEESTETEVYLSVAAGATYGGAEGSGAVEYRWVVSSNVGRVLSTACGANTTRWSDITVSEYGEGTPNSLLPGRVMLKVSELQANTTYAVGVEVRDRTSGQSAFYTATQARTVGTGGQCARVINAPFCSMVNFTADIKGTTGFQEDEFASTTYETFARLLAQYDCEDPRGYSAWRCPDCLAAYKLWACTVAFRECPASTENKPCRAICEDVVRKCPTILGFDKCPTNFIEYGPSGQCNTYGSDLGKSAAGAAPAVPVVASLLVLLVSTLATVVV